MLGGERAMLSFPTYCFFYVIPLENVLLLSFYCCFVMPLWLCLYRLLGQVLIIYRYSYLSSFCLSGRYQRFLSSAPITCGGCGKHAQSASWLWAATPPLRSVGPSSRPSSSDSSVIPVDGWVLAQLASKCQSLHLSCCLQFPSWFLAYIYFFSFIHWWL